MKKEEIWNMKDYEEELSISQHTILLWVKLFRFIRYQFCSKTILINICDKCIWCRIVNIPTHLKHHQRNSKPQKFTIFSKMKRKDDFKFWWQIRFVFFVKRCFLLLNGCQRCPHETDHMYWFRVAMIHIHI